MRKIYICSPCRGIDGNYRKNIANAIEYARSVSNLPDTLPIVPHIYFTQFMDDTDPGVRRKALAYGVELLRYCDELWVFGNEISDGMNLEIKVAKMIGIPVRYMQIEEVFP